MTITNGKYVGHTGTIESNVYQRSVDYPDWHNGFHVWLDTGVLVTVRWEQVVIKALAEGAELNKPFDL